MTDKILLSNIQRFSLHDGPGIRTTVFLKGCALRCPWCANPENIRPYKESYMKDGVAGIYGKEMTVEELYKEVMKDILYYRDGGGVTFSGGEPLLQADRLEALWRRLGQEGVHQCIETSLYVPYDNLLKAEQYIDLFYVDVKFLDEVNCREILGGESFIFKKNFEDLIENNRKVIVRIPIIGKYTACEENICTIMSFLEQYQIRDVELIQEHHLGMEKYRSLGLEAPNLVGVSENEMLFIQELFLKRNINAKICKI